MRRSGPPLAYLESNDPAVLETLRFKAAPVSPEAAQLPEVPVEHSHRPCPRCKIDADRLTLQDQLIVSISSKMKRRAGAEKEAFRALAELNESMNDFLATERLRKGVNEL